MNAATRQLLRQQVGQRKREQVASVREAMPHLWCVGCGVTLDHYTHGCRTCNNRAGRRRSRKAST